MILCLTIKMNPNYHVKLSYGKQSRARLEIKGLLDRTSPEALCYVLEKDTSTDTSTHLCASGHFCLFDLILTSHQQSFS